MRWGPAMRMPSSEFVDSDRGLSAVRDAVTELSATLIDLPRAALVDETLEAVFRLFVLLSVPMIPDMWGVSISLVQHEQFVTVSASHETVRVLDAAQYRTRSGPCIDAIRTGQPQYAYSADRLHERWPEFDSAAIAEGIGTVLSLPLEARGRTTGSLNLYAQIDGAFDDASGSVAASFARSAGAVLTIGAAYRDLVSTNTHLLDALASRQVIGEAVGIIMARDHCNADDAFDVLRRTSQSTNVQVRHAAEELVQLSATVTAN